MNFPGIPSVFGQGWASILIFAGIVLAFGISWWISTHVRFPTLTLPRAILYSIVMLGIVASAVAPSDAGWLSMSFYAACSLPILIYALMKLEQ